MPPYVAIALESIKKDGIVPQGITDNGVAQVGTPSSTISLIDLLKNVKPSDESFYKYIPKQFFDQNSRMSLNTKTEILTEIPQQDQGKFLERKKEEARD